MESKVAIQSVQKRKKTINWCRTLFILCCVALPVADFLIFYVYQNASAFTMAFTTKDGGFTFEHFVRFWLELKDPMSDLRIAFKNTFLSFGIMMLMFPFRVLVSYFIYKKIPGANIYRILFFIPSIIFSVAFAMILTRMLGVEGFIAQWVQELLHLDSVPELLADSRFANKVVLLHMVWLAFPGDLIVWGGTFSRIPDDVLESARLDGVTWWQEFTKIIVPLIWPTFSLQFILSFCGIFGAGGQVFLLTKGNYGTMTIDAWTYLQVYNVGGKDTSNALYYMSAVGLVLTVIAITWSLLLRRWTDKMFDDVEF